MIFHRKKYTKPKNRVRQEPVRKKPDKRYSDWHDMDELPKGIGTNEPIEIVTDDGVTYIISAKDFNGGYEKWRYLEQVNTVYGKAWVIRD